MLMVGSVLSLPNDLDQLQVEIWLFLQQQRLEALAERLRTKTVHSERAQRRTKKTRLRTRRDISWIIKFSNDFLLTMCTLLSDPLILLNLGPAVLFKTLTNVILFIERKHDKWIYSGLKTVITLKPHYFSIFYAETRAVNRGLLPIPTFTAPEVGTPPLATQALGRRLVDQI